MKFSIFLALALASTALAAPVTIYRGGNASKPVTKLRPEDMTEEKTSPVPNPIPSQQGTECGVSCSSNPNSNIRGKQWSIDSDKVNGSQDFTATHTPTDDDKDHYSIQSNKKMSPTEYQDKVNGLPWSKVSRREYEYEPAMY